MATMNGDLFSQSAAVAAPAGYDTPGWLTARQVTIAWLCGCVEQANIIEDRQFYLPRYLEHVGDAIAAHLRRCGGGDIFEVSPAQVGTWLRDFHARHAVVRDWPFDTDAAVLSAMRYLKYQIAQDA